MSEAIRQPWPENTHRLRVGDVEFDLRYRSVRRQGKVHELNQRCFDLLLLFLREPYLLHTRDEIFRRVWSGVVVEDANITTTIWVLRKALGDDAKGWIRTVSKQGYIFDPPGPLQPASANDPIGPDTLPADLPAVNDAPSADVADAHRPRLGAYVALGVCVLLILLLAALFKAPFPSIGPGRVVIATMPDASLTDDARWPVELLHDWVNWQLRSRPDRIAVADPSGPRPNNNVVVLLSVAMPTGKDRQWQVRAHFHHAGGEIDIERGATSERLIETIEEVGGEVVRRFMPELKAEQVPSLAALDLAVAPDLVKAITAENRGRWNEAVDRYRTVLAAVPEFGYARMHLAQSLAELGQSSAAQAELARAESWIARLPAAMQPVLRARALAIRQDYSGAAAAYGELWKNSIGDSLELRLAEATNLRKAGRSRDALERLDGIQPDAPAQALAWLIERTEIHLANRDLGLARTTATDAIALARTLGWDHERAQATLLLIDAHTFGGTQADEPLYTDAIEAFRSTGDRLGVLRAQFNLELRRPPAQHPRIDHLNELLAEARAAGNVTIETEALRRSGLYFFRGGDVPHARERFNQALAVAEAAGDRYLHRLVDLHLLRQDIARGDFNALDQRLGELGNEPLQGGMSFWVGLTTARLQFRRGQFDAALATLSATEDRLRATQARSLPQIAVGLACLRATIFTWKGRTADATTAVHACRSPEVPYFNNYAEIGEAEVDSLSGDVASVRARLPHLVRLVTDEKAEPERWSLAAEVAPILVRFGEAAQAREVIDALLPAVERSGQHMIEADLRISLAYAALMQGLTDEAEQQAAFVDKLVPPDDWIGRRNLRIALIAIHLARGRDQVAQRELAALHDDARRLGDVLTEIATHSMAGSTLDAVCTAERHDKLLGQSGLRGATTDWLIRPHLARTPGP